MTTTPPKKKSKPKLLELDIVRAIAILAVVAIHSTSDATVDLAFGSGSHALYLAINKLCNFAVPVFIMVSGLVLFYRYDGDWSGRQSVQFYLRRVKQVLFPYLLWSFFYYMYNQWIYQRATLHFNWSEFGDLLPWADASYHLYFMVIIVQFYLLFPIMMWLCGYSWFRRGLIWVGLLIQAVFYSYNHWVEPIANMPSLCVNYFSMFMLGGWMGLNYEVFFGWLKRWIGLVLPVTVLLGCSFMLLFVLEGRLPFMLEGTWYTLLFFAYAAFACMSFIWLGRVLVNRAPKLAQAFLSLGAASFGIYLVHPAVLTYWKSHVSSDVGDIRLYHAYVAVAFVLTLFVPWLLVYGYGKFMKLFRKKSKPAALPGRA
ncbi:acyltransferase [Paenibacillus cremeus]|uniref:Acyltransferase n=1 Tax=Paenibacillus cremeus TaxID=2163881 RepID=A0A559K5J3_9BACL|nr:acyltransferase [Paenibacillus cremeus]TVY07418.1 acyltransferase [Paenibacillus cremeus]